MKWNQDIFVNNVQWIIDHYCDANASKFNETVGQRDAMTRWKIPGYRPSLAVLLKITENYPVTLDWLITGEISNPQPHPCAGLEEHCPKMKKIILSNHPVITPAFLANLAAFEYSIDRERTQDSTINEHTQKIVNMKKRIVDLETAVQKGLRTGTDGAASSSTGKPGT